MPEVAQEYTETRITPPTRRSATRVELELGNRRAVSWPTSAAGTRTTTSSSSCRTCTSSSPGIWSSRAARPPSRTRIPLDWPGTLGRLLDVATAPVVPGHGEVVGKAFVEGQLADLSALAELARRVRFDGGSVDDALPLAPFPVPAGRQALTRAFAQLAGEL